MNLPIPLTTEALSWHADGAEILKNIDLQVAASEFVGILGPNGSGKSTLLRCIFKYLRPTSGVVTMDGVDIKQFSVKETAQQMATVLQERNAEFSQTVLDFVLLGRTPHKKIFERETKEDTTIAKQALEQVGMASFCDRDIKSLSGGELQRVMLARALCQQAKILILDEPTNHLDIRFQLEIMGLIKAMKITTIAALHELNLAAMYCDTIYVLSQGSIVAYGKPVEILTEKLIEEVYGVKVEIFRNPVTGTITIVFLPQHLQGSL